MKVFVFVLVMILPDGQTKMKSEVVLQCPPKEGVEEIFNQAKQGGHIIDWGATCITYKFDVEPS